MRNIFDDKARLEWLQGESGKNLNIGSSRPPMIRHEIPLEGNIGTATLTFVDLPLGMSAAHSEYIFESKSNGALIPVIRAVSEFNSEVFIAYTLKSGRCVYDDAHLGKKYQQDKRETLFIRTDRYDTTGFVDSGEKCTLYCIIIPVLAINTLVGSDASASLLSSVELGCKNSFSKKIIPHNISSTLYLAVDHKMDGLATVLHSQAKCLEYLSQIIDHFGVGKTRSQQISSKSQKRVRELESELNSLKGKIPTLDQLAARYNVTADTLNNDFKKEFGKTIYNFIMERRLLEARSVVENSSTPLKVISENLGYSHTNHFLSAFKRKFGYSPSSLRKAD